MVVSLENISAFYAVVSSRKPNTLFMTMNPTLNDQQNKGCYSADTSSFWIGRRPRRRISKATRVLLLVVDLLFFYRESPTETILFISLKGRPTVLLAQVFSGFDREGIKHNIGISPFLYRNKQI